MTEFPPDFDSRLHQLTLHLIDIVRSLPRERVHQEYAETLLRIGISPSDRYAEAVVSGSTPMRSQALVECARDLQRVRAHCDMLSRAAILKDPAVLTALSRECDGLIALLRDAESAQPLHSERRP